MAERAYQSGRLLEHQHQLIVHGESDPSALEMTLLLYDCLGRFEGLFHSHLPFRVVGTLLNHPQPIPGVW